MAALAGEDVSLYAVCSRHVQECSKQPFTESTGSTLACRVCRVSSFGNTEFKTLNTKFGGSPHWACATWHVALPAYALRLPCSLELLQLLLYAFPA